MEEIICFVIALYITYFRISIKPRVYFSFVNVLNLNDYNDYGIQVVNLKESLIDFL